MTHTTAPAQRRPAWREPLLWLVIGLPLSVLVAGALLIRTAVQAGPLDSAPGVRRMGQVQVLTEDRRAAPAPPPVRRAELAPLQSGDADRAGAAPHIPRVENAP